MATERVQILIDAKNNATAQLKSVTQELNKMDKAAKFVVGGFAALGGAAAAVQLGRFALDMAQLNVQAERSAFAFEHFSGGADQAAANLRAVQRASGGMLTTFEAQNIAVTAMTQGLASNSQELERITKIARGIVAVSPIINDLESAFSQLGLTIANQSMMRLDQLGTSASELKPKIEALKEANSSLTSEMAFQQALLDTLESKFDPLTDAVINQASGVERLKTAWQEYRIEAARAFGFIDSIAGRMADTLSVRGKGSVGADIASGAIEAMTAEQRAIADEIKSILSDPKNLGAAATGGFLPADAENQIAKLVDEFLRLQDAEIMAAEANRQVGDSFADTQNTTDAQFEAMRKVNEQLQRGVQSGAERIFQQVFSITGDAEEATRAYEQALRALNYQLGELQNVSGLGPEKLLMALPVMIDRLQGSVSKLYETQEAAEGASIGLEKVGAAAAATAGNVVRTTGTLSALARSLVVTKIEALNFAGAVGAAFDMMAEVAGDRSGAKFGGLSELIKTPMAMGDGMKSIALEAGGAKSAVASVNSEFENLKSTISGIVTGAIGPVAGVDANDLLPRPDAVNENARRLADIAVNGFKGQDWLQQFQNEVPDIYQALVESGDPKMAAATMLKDFQDGLLSGTGVLIDKERAKDLVRRALLGQSNTQALINEIAQELAAETGTAFGTVQAQAQSLLGGGGMSQNGETGAAFARGMVTGVADSTVGADVTGVVYGQIMASIGVIERSGRDAGSGWASGFMSGAADLPTNIIAMIVRLVTPGVVASMNTQGTRTGAAGT